MAEGVYITRTEWNELVKKITYLEDYIRNRLKATGKSKWVSQQEAMELLGCKKTKLNMLRYAGELEWKNSGGGRNVMINRKSIEDFIERNSNS